MNRLTTGALLCGAAALCTLLLWQRHELARQEQLAHARTGELARVAAANAGLALALGRATAARARDNALVAGHARALDQARDASAGLERQLREALTHAQHVDLDAPLPGVVLESLCLRWHAASGTLGSDGAGDPAAGAAAPKGHSPAPGCDAWKGVSLRQVLEWTGRLLDHAGSERLDKAALRAWAGRTAEDGEEK